MKNILIKWGYFHSGSIDMLADSFYLHAMAVNYQIVRRAKAEALKRDTHIMKYY